MTAPLPFSPASERNREPIARVLGNHLPASGRVLEVGAGTGQHVVYFARRFPAVQWLPSDMPADLSGLERRIGQEGGPNVLPPIRLDAAELPWPVEPVDVVYSANTAHIMSWPEARAMIQGAAGVLRSGGLFILYGPFRYGKRHTSSSNAAFHASLQQRDPAMGIRDAIEVTAHGRKHGLEAMADETMPANNRTLIFRKRPS